MGYRKEEVDSKNIYGGTVSLVKIVDTETEIEGSQELSKTISKKVVAIDIRKIVFEKNEDLLEDNGSDIFYKLSRKQPYTYTVVDGKPNNIQNNTLIIRNPIPFGSVLNYAGYSDVIKGGELTCLREEVMDRRESLLVQEQITLLNEYGILNNEKIETINSQSIGLLEFKRNELPTKPQKIEKVYAKYFK